MSNKRKFTKKTSIGASALLLFSMLTPTLASAAVSTNALFTYDGTISGQLRFDGSVGEAVYNQSEVTVGVFGSGGAHIQDVTVTFSSYHEGTSYYTLPTFQVDSVLHAVYFQYGSDQPAWLYRESDPEETEEIPDDSGTGSETPAPGGSGGSGGSDNGSESEIDPDTVPPVLESTDGKINPELLRIALSKHQDVVLRVAGESIDIPASAFVDVNQKAVLTIEFEQGSYVLPMSAFRLVDLADQANAAVSDMTLHISFVELIGQRADAVKEAIQNLGARQLASAYELKFEVVAGGVTTEIPNFDQYVTRKMPLSTSPTGTATIALYDPDSKQLSFVPGSIRSNEATFWRTGNSIYTVLELDKKFVDIDSHWAAPNIELMASKLIAEGATDTSFQPDRNLTRAELIALVTRAFGLVEVHDGTYFSDVRMNDWYAGAVAAAARAGLINGYADDTFRPNETINREELAAIVMRAYRYAGGTIDSNAALALRWEDADDIVWANKEIAAAVDKGFIQGMTSSTLEPAGSATRAQTVTLLKRVLENLKFME